MKSNQYLSTIMYILLVKGFYSNDLKCLHIWDLDFGLASLVVTSEHNEELVSGTSGEGRQQTQPWEHL